MFVVPLIPQAEQQTNQEGQAPPVIGWQQCLTHLLKQNYYNWGTITKFLISYTCGSYFSKPELFH